MFNRLEYGYRLIYIGAFSVRGCHEDMRHRWSASLQRSTLASQSYMTLRLISRKFITSNLMPSGSSKNVA